MNCKVPRIDGETTLEYRRRRQRDRDEAKLGRAIKRKADSRPNVKVGDTFGRLTAMGSSTNSKVRVPCSCSCGVVKNVTTRCLVVGDTKSCGCLKRDATSESRATHRLSGTMMHNRWNQMIMRCHNEKHISYYRYGGSGIYVCDRWRKSFADFLSDVGYPPTNRHSLDRWPNCAGNYEPGNVRWATAVEQAKNTRRNVWITAAGRTMCLSDWELETGINRHKIQRLIKSGMSPEIALGVNDETI